MVTTERNVWFKCRFRHLNSTYLAAVVVAAGLPVVGHVEQPRPSFGRLLVFLANVFLERQSSKESKHVRRCRLIVQMKCTAERNQNFISISYVMLVCLPTPACSESPSRCNLPQPTTDASAVQCRYRAPNEQPAEEEGNRNGKSNNARRCGLTSNPMKERSNGRTSEQINYPTNQRTNEPTIDRSNKRTSKAPNEQNDRANKRSNARTCHQTRTTNQPPQPTSKKASNQLNERKSDRTNTQTNERTNERTNHRTTNERTIEQTNQRMNQPTNQPPTRQQQPSNIKPSNERTNERHQRTNERHQRSNSNVRLHEFARRSTLPAAGCRLEG